MIEIDVDSHITMNHTVLGVITHTHTHTHKHTHTHAHAHAHAHTHTQCHMDKNTINEKNVSVF